jgi:hypothetical protein
MGVIANRISKAGPSIKATSDAANASAYPSEVGTGSAIKDMPHR